MAGLLAAGLGGLAVEAATLTNRVAIQRDFRIFDYYRGSQRLKTLLRGGEAAYLLHPIPVQQVVIETYTESGLTNLIATAQSCLADRTNRTASSSGPLALRLSEGRFTLEGTGFLWSQTNTSLIVSNQVRSVLRGDLLRGELPRP